MRNGDWISATFLVLSFDKYPFDTFACACTGIISAAEGITIVRPFLNAFGERPGEPSAILPCGDKLY